MSKRLFPIALIAASFAALGAAPYQSSSRVQPAAPQVNTFFGASLAVGDLGIGLAGSFNGVVNAFAAPASGPLLLGQSLSSGVSADLFGASVALASPQTIGSFAAVGAFGDDTFALNSGKVYTYRLQANVLAPFVDAGVIGPPNPSSTGNFGYSVAAQGNFVFVGEVKALNANAEVVGAVHIFENTGGNTWQLRTSLFGNQLDGANGRRFGHAIAVSGNTLVVGAPRENQDGATTAGAVYVYTGSGANWNQQARLVAQDFASDDELGAAVDIDGDILVAGGARDDKQIGVDAGGAYIFTRSGSSWSQSAKLVSSGAQVRNLFGSAVSVSGTEVAIGAYCEVLSAPACSGGGTVEIFRRGALGNWIAVQLLTAADGAFGEAFGNALSHSGAGGSTLVVGAFRAGAVNNAGAIYHLRGDEFLVNGFE